MLVKRFNPWTSINFDACNGNQTQIKEREKEMAEQPNLEQQEKQDTNSSSSYVPSQPINSFNLGYFSSQ